MGDASGDRVFKNGGRQHVEKAIEPRGTDGLSRGVRGLDFRMRKLEHSEFSQSPFGTQSNRVT